MARFHRRRRHALVMLDLVLQCCDLFRQLSRQTRLDLFQTDQLSTQIVARLPRDRAHQLAMPTQGTPVCVERSRGAVT